MCKYYYNIYCTVDDDPIWQHFVCENTIVSFFLINRKDYSMFFFFLNYNIRLDFWIFLFSRSVSRGGIVTAAAAAAADGYYYVLFNSGDRSLKSPKSIGVLATRPIILYYTTKRRNLARTTRLLWYVVVKILVNISFNVCRIIKKINLGRGIHRAHVWHGPSPDGWIPTGWFTNSRLVHHLDLL